MVQHKSVEHDSLPMDRGSGGPDRVDTTETPHSTYKEYGRLTESSALTLITAERSASSLPSITNFPDFDPGNAKTLSLIFYVA